MCVLNSLADFASLVNKLSPCTDCRHVGARWMCVRPVQPVSDDILVLEREEVLRSSLRSRLVGCEVVCEVDDRSVCEPLVKVPMLARVPTSHPQSQVSGMKL